MCYTKRGHRTTAGWDGKALLRETPTERATRSVARSVALLNFLVTVPRKFPFPTTAALSLPLLRLHPLDPEEARVQVGALGPSSRSGYNRSYEGTDQIRVKIYA